MQKHKHNSKLKNIYIFGICLFMMKKSDDHKVDEVGQ